MAVKVARKGSRIAAASSGTRRPKRTAQRSVIASCLSRLPGTPGARLSVPGSIGGKNGARSARRAARRGIHIRNSRHVLPVLSRSLIAHSTLDLLEVFADPESQLAKVWAMRGFSSVRVCELKQDVPPSLGPTPVAGRHQSWYLDLARPTDRKMLLDYASLWCPRDLWSAPPCTAFSRVQFLNQAQKPPGWRPPCEKVSLELLDFCRRELHPGQVARGGRSHHEQSERSRVPFDNRLRASWPWAVSCPVQSQTVAGCQVGLREQWGARRLLSKEWRIESTSSELLSALTGYSCPGGHKHGECLRARQLRLTGGYTPLFANLVYEAIQFHDM